MYVPCLRCSTRCELPDGWTSYPPTLCERCALAVVRERAQAEADAALVGRLVEQLDTLGLEEVPAAAGAAPIPPDLVPDPAPAAGRPAAGDDDERVLLHQTHFALGHQLRVAGRGLTSPYLSAAVRRGGVTIQVDDSRDPEQWVTVSIPRYLIHVWYHAMCSL
jgi:hypothetical protein